MNPQVNKINEDIESLRFLIKETQKRISLLEEDLKSKYNIEPYKRDINADIKRIDSVLIKNYNITFNEVIAKNRKTYVVLKRHIIAYFLSVDRGYELKQIGREMLNRDHSTIINSRKKANILPSERHGIIDCKNLYNEIINEFNQIKN
mgnify:CR=1 FL=1